MLLLERVRSDIGALPSVARLGVFGLVLAGIGDVVAHLEMTGHAGHLHQHATAEQTAHLAAFGSMVLILLGVVVDGVRRSRKGVS